MTKKGSEAPKFPKGAIVEYHGRNIEIVDPPAEVETPQGAKVTLLRVKDPRRGIRGMFLWQLEEGLGAKPDPVLQRADEGFR